MFGYIKNLLFTAFIKFFDKHTKKKLLLLGYIFYFLSYTKKSKSKAKEMILLFKNKHPYFLWWEKVIVKLDINIKKKFIGNFFINTFNGKYIKKRRNFESKYGYYPPHSLIISITSKCNYSCKGCWAKRYDDKSELSYEKWKEILSEAKNDMGIFSFYITGGEPFMREDFYTLAKEFNDCLFFTYTNASLLTDEIINKIKNLGNIYPMISINGFEKDNIELRNDSAYNIAFDAMKKISSAGIFWGTCSVATSNNIETICSDEYYKMLSDKGAFWAWILDFVPSGAEEDINCILSGEQKLRLHNAVHDARNTYPMITFDFYDAYEVGGCTAAGHRIVHITSNGDVEPCPFIHLSTDNLNTKTLKEALKSNFIKEIRKNIPYQDGNCLRPCLILDRPEILKSYVEKFEPKATQHDFLNLIFDERQFSTLYNNAQNTKIIMDKTWSSRKNIAFL